MHEKFNFIALFVFIFLLIPQFPNFPIPQERQKTEADLPRIVHKIQKGIAFCYSDNSKTTGFFVSKDGWMITAGHKVDRDFPKASKIYVKINPDDEEIFESTKIIAPLESFDIMLFKIDYKPGYYFKKFKEAHMFEENWIVGYRGVANVTISPKGYIATNRRKPHLLYSTASIYFGNSGSVVINKDGEVLGVTTEGYPFGDCYVVPAPVVEKYIKENTK